MICGKYVVFSHFCLFLCPSYMSYFKWHVCFMFAKHRFSIFGIIIPNGLSEMIQRICNLVFHILWELRVKIFKNYEDKAKWLLLTFVSTPLICPISNGMFPSQGTPKVLLEPHKNFILIMELYKLHKIGRKSKKSSLQSKTQTLHILNIMVPSWLSTIILGFCNMIYHILWGFRGNFNFY